MLVRSARPFAFNVLSVRAVRFLSEEPPIMKVVRQNLKLAMQSGDVTGKNVMRAIMSTVKNANIETPNSVNTDLKFHDTMQSMINKRQKAIEEYRAGNREDLVEKEVAEIDILNKLVEQVDMASDLEVEEKLRALTSQNSIPLEKSSMKQIMSTIPWNSIESDWRASRKMVVGCVQRLTQKSSFSTMRVAYHENPLVREN
jgi:uncharacterized protein YqeY